MSEKQTYHTSGILLLHVLKREEERDTNPVKVADLTAKVYIREFGGKHNLTVYDLQPNREGNLLQSSGLMQDLAALHAASLIYWKDGPYPTLRIGLTEEGRKVVGETRVSETFEKILRN